MPNGKESRDMIRQTWLNPKYWILLGFEIKIIFLVASVDRQEINQLQSEIDKYDDILILNYTESHYGLPAKDYNFMAYIEQKCR